MPSSIYVADLPQIPIGAPSPTIFPHQLYGDDEISEREEDSGGVSSSSAGVMSEPLLL